jgi:type IV pilus assembly protein PilC
MISLSTFIKDGGWVLIVVLFAVLFSLPYVLKKTQRTRETYNKFILKLPVVGKLNKEINLTRFSENLSVLLKAGLPITQALKIVENIIESPIYKKIIAQARESVAKGERISAVFNNYPEEVPPFVVQMIATGEETGELDEVLEEVVKFYRQDIDRMVERLPNVIEPLLILILGLGVAVLAVSVFIPLFKVGMGGIGR